VGIEALTRLQAEAALGDQPLQRPRGREALAVALLVFLELLQDRVEALEVRLPGWREEPAPRVEAGPRHHPEVDLAHGADPLLEHLAGLDERLEHEQIRELLRVRLGVPLDARLPVLVEALATRLGAELAVGDEA